MQMRVFNNLAAPSTNSKKTALSLELPLPAMRLYEAAVACRLYSPFGGEFDDSTMSLRSRTGGVLHNENHPPSS